MMTSLGFHCNRLNHLEDRVLANDLRRGELYNYKLPDVPLLKDMASRYDLVTSIHTPLVRPEWYPDPPTWTFLCDVDEELRQLNLLMVEQTMEMAEDFGAEYVVVHFPSPISPKAAGVSLEKQRHIAWDSANRLAELSQRHKLPVHVEGFGPSPFYNTEFLTEVLGQLSVLRYCFDTGHTFIAAQRDGFDYYEFGRAMAPYLGSIHLWNTRGLDDYVNYRHIPVHPAQRAEDGWVDVECILFALRSVNPVCPVVFESSHWYPEALGDFDYRDGVTWVKELVATSF